MKLLIQAYQKTSHQTNGHTNDHSNSNKNSPRQNQNSTMKSFKLIPLFLAGFCGYIHTVINRRFDEMGVFMTGSPSDNQQNVLIDMPRSSSNSAGNVPFNSIIQQQQQQQQRLNLFQNQNSMIGGTSSGPLLDINQLMGPSVDASNAGMAISDFDWTKPPKPERVMSESPDYQETLLQYTLNLLPNHQHKKSSSSSTKDAAGADGRSGETNNNNKKVEHKDYASMKMDTDTAVAASTASNKDSDDDAVNPKAYDYNQIDILVPASGQDRRLFVFADRLGVALKSYNTWYETERKPAILRRMNQDQEDTEEIKDKIAVAAEAEALEEEASRGEKEENQQQRRLLTADDLPENGENNKLDLTFRLLVTRYPEDAQKTPTDFRALRKTLSEKTSLPESQIRLLRVGKDLPASDFHVLKFNRAHARNVLLQNACQLDTCLVTSVDVDMQILPVFFHRALKTVKPFTRAYFPIVFSEYNPRTVQLVQDFFYTKHQKLKAGGSDGSGDDNKNGNGNNNNVINNEGETESLDDNLLLPPYSQHRGLWRDFGYGMYAIAGSDVKRFRFNEKYQGWGHEDNDFYKLVHSSMQVHRQREHGLIHGWHPKNCAVGSDIITKQQWIDCLRSKDAMEGSILGLLLRPPLPTRREEDFPGYPTKPPGKDGYITTKKKKKNKKTVEEEDTGDAEGDDKIDTDDDPGDDVEVKDTIDKQGKGGEEDNSNQAEKEETQDDKPDQDGANASNEQAEGSSNLDDKERRKDGDASEEQR